LANTSLSANTAIYNCSPALVYFFSIFILGDSITILKVFSVISCIIGVIVVALFGNNNDNSSQTNVFGLIMVSVSALTFAIYEVALGKMVSHTTSTSLSKSVLILGFIGIWTSILLWPFFIIFHYTGVETFELPYNNNLLALILTVILDLVLNTALLVGVQLCGPLFMSIGSLMTIPVSVIIDKIFNHYVLPWPSFLGIFLIVLGFVGINIIGGTFYCYT